MQDSRAGRVVLSQPVKCLICTCFRLPFPTLVAVEGGKIIVTELVNETDSYFLLIVTDHEHVLFLSSLIKSIEQSGRARLVGVFLLSAVISPNLKKGSEGEEDNAYRT